METYSIAVLARFIAARFLAAAVSAINRDEDLTDVS